MAGLPGLGIMTTTGADCAPAVTPLMTPPIIAAAIAMDAASFILYDHLMSGPPFHHGHGVPMERPITWGAFDYICYIAPALAYICTHAPALSRPGDRRLMARRWCIIVADG